MWKRSDFEDGYETYKTGSSIGGSPGWLPNHEWQSKPPSLGSSMSGRRHSTVSDSGDTGIGTYCSDSVEDDSSTSTTPSTFQPLSHHHSGQEDGFGGGPPVVHVMPSPSTSPYTSLRIPVSTTNSGRWSRSCHLLTPTTSPISTPSSLDMKDHQPIRRWSSLTKLSSSTDKCSSRTTVYQCIPDSQGSLDRGLRYGYEKDLYLPLSSSSLGHSLLQRSPGAGPCYWNKYSSRSTGLETDLSLSSALSSPVKHSSLDMNYSALPEIKLAMGGGQIYGFSLPKSADSSLGHQTDRDSPIQPSVRTQIWLTEQMEYSSKAEHATEPGHISGANMCGGDGLSPLQGHQQELGLNQMLMGTTHPVNTLVKVKEGLLRQRELEIDRQKQQILQLHARIRENELRVQQVLQSQRGWLDEPSIMNTKDSVIEVPRKPPPDLLCCDDELGRKVAVAELEVLHLKELFRQTTQKYTEDIRKLEEKIKTRDRYISSLKKKSQRETEQNQEKQQRIETLEKYLADLPTLDEVQVQALQLEEVQKKAKDLERTISQLQMSIEEGCALLKDKDVKIETQDRREKELIASVHSLQQKVRQCFEDGVRLPMLDLKQLEVENTQLQQQHNHSSRMIEHQKAQIARLTSQFKSADTRLQKRKGLPQQSFPMEKEERLPTPCRTFPWVPDQQSQDDERFEVLVEAPEMRQLLKEMSLCLLDLQALCNILVQRAQGKELNLSLLLGMKSLNTSTEQSDCRYVAEDELKLKLGEVGQLRRDIDELRTSISDCYAHYVGDNCVSQ